MRVYHLTEKQARAVAGGLGLTIQRWRQTGEDEARLRLGVGPTRRYQTLVSYGYIQRYPRAVNAVCQHGRRAFYAAAIAQYPGVRFQLISTKRKFRIGYKVPERMLYAENVGRIAEVVPETDEACNC
jgi:hypothetical protein